ncbi:multidrug resistance protein, putative [Entamoeba invadens IP1]|uniref:Multidrug resistance protein, putative n=1 Tax=Entamoeba invadens IP1 TaxID=370355 RepID=L7FN38_ENTIV|nr:multidrug resistance protein, putative [Entamoeba invadens IP1]ELP90962.1 multidrug resistance protein, putative [Entamoeba invadens IP1]|eukprot:XP_004257733.1 multidrug resistance protein, putative [Entamoeba invadens IP1]
MLFTIDTLVFLLQITPTTTSDSHILHEFYNKVVELFCFSFWISVTVYFYDGLLLSSKEKLNIHLKKKLYSKLLQQNVEYFDRKENSLGSVMNKLNSETKNTLGVTGDNLGVLFKIISEIICGVVLVLFYYWQLGLCIIAIFPVLLFFLFWNGYLNSEQSSPAIKAYEKSGNTLIEAIEAIKTVQSLGKENFFGMKYAESLENPRKGIFKWGFLLGIFEGINVFIYKTLGSFTFYVGFKFVRKSFVYDTNVSVFMKQLMDKYVLMQKGTYPFINACTTCINHTEVIPEMGRSLTSAKSVFDIIDRQLTIIEMSDLQKTENIDDTQKEQNNAKNLKNKEINNNKKGIKKFKFETKIEGNL